MKIVHVLPSLARGGGERLTIELANCQVEAGHEVALLLGSDLPADQVHAGLDCRVKSHTISSASGRSRYGAMLPWIWQRRSWIASADVLHCHLTYGALFALAFVGLRRNPQPAIVETYHAVGMPISPVLKWLHAKLATRWDGLALMADDPWWSDFSGRNPGLAFRIIPVGVDSPPFVSKERRDEYRRQMGIPHDATVVATVGRFVAERRPRAYIPVFERIAKQLGGVHFLMGGDGPELEAIRAEADAAGIRDRLHLPGLIRLMELPLAVADLYVTANVGSAPGVAGLQAIAAGVPTIAIQLRENYRPEPSDWIWSSDRADDLASRAIELLADSAVAKALMERQARHLKDHHSPEAMAAEYERFYLEAIQAKGRSGRQ